MTNQVVAYSRENGGRVLILFLLFFLAMYQFVKAGLPALAIVCLIPLVIPAIYAAFRWQMLTFWTLIIINYFVMFFGKLQMLPNGIPTSLYNELLELLLIGIALIDLRQSPHFERLGNLMFLTLLIWFGFCTIEVFNDTCGLGIDVGGWYGGARMMAIQLVYACVVFTLYITDPDKLIKYLRIWAILCLFSYFWTWKQQTFGFTASEKLWLETRGRVTHVINGGTLIRYWSTFNDAACYGCHAAASAITFFIIAITTNIKRDRIFFLITALLVTKGMFASGTRTAMFCMIGGFLVFLVLSRSVKILIPSAIIGGLLFSLLVFTNIGQGNQQIRRMRSAFDKNDASAGVREINQATIKKYIADAPWGLGLAVSYDNVPANNKYNKLSKIPPDSEYVFIWVHTGVIGITNFLILTAIMFAGACWISLFKL